MKQITRKFIICAALVIASLLPAAVQANGNRGHHQSGIIGRVQVEQSGLPFLWQVRVSTDTCEPITVVQTEDDGQFVVNLKPGTYRLRPFVPLWWVGLNGERLYAEFNGPPVQVTVAKKDFTVVELPLSIPWPQNWQPGDKYQPVEVGDGTWLIPF